MNKIAYQIKGTLFRNKNDETNLVEIDEVFENENPIIAREMAFEKYQSYLDVFLQGIDKEFVGYNQAVIDLQDFVNSHQKKYVKLGGEEIKELEMDVDFDKGLCINFIEDKNDIYVTKTGQKLFNNWSVIYCIDNQFSDNLKVMVQGLLNEYKIYKTNNYDCKHYDKYAHITGKNGLESNLVLKTPMFI